MSSDSRDWPQWIRELSVGLRNLRSGAPDVMKGFSSIAQAALQPSALDAKTKELIALAIGIAVRCDDCIAFHVKAAIDHGATREEAQTKAKRLCGSDCKIEVWVCSR